MAAPDARLDFANLPVKGFAEPMGTLFFFMILACHAVVLAWYALNESRGADGELGVLAISPTTRENEAQPDAAPGAYRIKERGGKPGLASSESSAPAYRTIAERKAFRPQEKAGYRALARNKKDPETH